jgi:hypothetical protein
MKITSAIQHDSVRSSLETVRARRSSGSGIESTGGHPTGSPRRAFVQTVTGDGHGDFGTLADARM